MGLEDSVKEIVKKMNLGIRITLMLLMVSIIVFLVLWGSMRFTLPAFLTDVKLVEKAGLFALWTIGAIVFGVALATFFIGRKLGNVVRGK